MKRTLLALVAFVLCAWGADPTGTWKGSIETPNGAFENTFTFKADGAKLTGSVDAGAMGKSDISDGKVDGDKISFTVVRDFNGQEFRMNYKGAVAADEIKLTIEVPAMDRTVEMTLKKAS
jgi:hypothetical protein